MATKVVVAMYLQNIDIRHLNGETFLQRPPHSAGRQDWLGVTILAVRGWSENSRFFFCLANNTLAGASQSR
jgi:hypothetical protein